MKLFSSENNHFNNIYIHNKNNYIKHYTVVNVILLKYFSVYDGSALQNFKAALSVTPSSFKYFLLFFYRCY